MLGHAPWTQAPGLVHGFLGARECGHGRDWRAVLARRGVAAPVVTPRQVHGTRVVSVDAPGPVGAADAVVTATRGLVVGVVTADCTPVLLRTRDDLAVAAVHAGWRGAAAGVLEGAVDALTSLAGVPPSDVDAAIGPAVGACCYQVDHEVREAFVRRSGDTTASAWRPDGDRLRLELREAVRLLLDAAGVTRTTIVGPCTVCGPDLHSYRRDGEGAGRQLSFIGRL